MNKQASSLLKKYLSAFLIGAVCVYAYAASREAGTLSGAALYRVLADAFTIPGLLMVCFGLLLVFSNEGALDGVGFGVSHMIAMLIPGKAAGKRETYLEYVERKRANRAKGFGFILITGAVYLAAAGVFILLYYHTAA